MPISSYNFIEEAERSLASGSVEEITYRNVVSRSYYGLYHCALSHADTLLTPPLSACAGGSHKKVSDYYLVGLAKSREETIKFRKVSIKLLQLHGQRIKADYRLDESVFVHDAESVLQTSKDIVRELIALGAAA